MTRCQHCHAQTQLYLCQSCQTQLANMLAQLPWLIDELDTRIECLDRISVGTVGRNRRPNEFTIIDFDAVETARRVRKTLLHWVTTVAQRHTGRQPPALGTVATKQLARWLEANVGAIARIDLAHRGRHPLYDDINNLVGTTERGGQLINAIDRHETHFAGTCPTTTGHHHDGEPIQCETMLYANTGDTTITCPTCKHTIDVEQNRRRSAATRDLRTTTEILESLNILNEPVNQQQLDQWIQAKRLRIKGWRHNGNLAATRVNQHSQPVYSLQRARKLRRRDQQLTQRQEATAQ